MAKNRGEVSKKTWECLSFLFGGVIHIADWIIEDSTSLVAYEYSFFFPHQMMILDLVNPVYSELDPQYITTISQIYHHMYWSVFPCFFVAEISIFFWVFYPIFLGWFPNFFVAEIPRIVPAVFSRWKKAQQCSNSANALQSYGNSSNRRSSHSFWLDW